MQIKTTEDLGRLRIIDAPFGAEPHERIDFDIEVHIEAEWAGLEYPLADARKERAFYEHVRSVLVAAVNGCEEAARASGMDPCEIARNLRHWPEMLAVCERLVHALAFLEEEMRRRQAGELLAALEAARAVLRKIRGSVIAGTAAGPGSEPFVVQAKAAG